MASISGTTANAYVNALEWDSSAFDKNTVIIKNTDVANALKLQVFVLADHSGIEYPQTLSGSVTEKVLAAGEMELVPLIYAYVLIKVAIKSNVSDTHATYQVDYTGGLQR